MLRDDAETAQVHRTGQVKPAIAYKTGEVGQRHRLAVALLPLVKIHPRLRRVGFAVQALNAELSQLRRHAARLFGFLPDRRQQVRICQHQRIGFNPCRLVKIIVFRIDRPEQNQHVIGVENAVKDLVGECSDFSPWAGADIALGGEVAEEWRRPRTSCGHQHVDEVWCFVGVNFVDQYR